MYNTAIRFISILYCCFACLLLRLSLISYIISFKRKRERERRIKTERKKQIRFGSALVICTWCSFQTIHNSNRFICYRRFVELLFACFSFSCVCGAFFQTVYSVVPLINISPRLFTACRKEKKYKLLFAIFLFLFLFLLCNVQLLFCIFFKLYSRYILN